MSGQAKKTARDEKNAQFKADLAEVARAIDELVSLTKKVASLPKASQLKLANGQVIGRSEVNSMKTELKQAIQKNLYNSYKRTAGEYKTTRTGGGNQNFSLPKFMTDPLRNFFAAANLGPVDPTRPQSPTNPAIQDTFRFLNGEGFELATVNQNLMTPLFHLYRWRNLNTDSGDVRADALMLQYLGDLFVNVSAETLYRSEYNRLSSQEKAAYDARGLGLVPEGKLNQNRFTTNRFQTITSAYTYTEKELPAELQEYRQMYAAKGTPQYNQLIAQLDQTAQVVTRAREAAKRAAQ